MTIILQLFEETMFYNTLLDCQDTLKYSKSVINFTTISKLYFEICDHPVAYQYKIQLIRTCKNDAYYSCMLH